jgi:beta-glucanase (GH16 family)
LEVSFLDQNSPADSAMRDNHSSDNARGEKNDIIRVMKTAVCPVVSALLLLFCASVSNAQSPGIPANLVWSDEFDGPSGAPPDPAKWTYDTGAGGWGNKEEETYCRPGAKTAPCNPNQPNALLDGDGHLVIRAVRSGRAWTSARLKTEGLQDFRYGRLEARMKLPTGPGVWPAFWALGTNIKSVGWPKCGEMDIMEWVPKYGPETTSSTLHGPASKGPGDGAENRFPGTAQVDTDFHNYGVIWSPGSLQFYRDDPSHPFFTRTESTVRPGDWVYGHPFYLLLNLAIGGNFPGPSSETTPNPAIMLVDYVRVYQ